MSLEGDDEGNELSRRVLHRAQGHGLPVARRVEDVRRQRGDLGRRRGRCPADQIVERLQPERSQQAGEQGGAFATPVLSARGDVQRASPQPVPAALVPQLPAIAARAVQLPRWIARVRDRAGARADDDPGSVRERHGERDLAVRHDAHATGQPGVHEGAFQLRLLLEPSCSGRRYDCPLHREVDVRLRRGAAPGLAQHSGRGRGAPWLHRGGRSVGAAEDRQLGGPDHHSGVGPAGVGAEKDGGP